MTTLPSAPATPPASAVSRACAVLNAGPPTEKAAKALAFHHAWNAGSITALSRSDDPTPPDRPARPDRPVLTPPGQVPRRRLTSAKGRIALLHAIAHIEFNAIDLAFDIIARFIAAPELNDTDPKIAHSFVTDWAQVGADEARHFTMITKRLDQYGARYGDLPAHDGLWSAANATATDLAARLAIAPLVLEARGLDVTPGMIDKLTSVGDTPSADVLHIIYTEEISHVAAGSRWFHHVAQHRQACPQQLFDHLVRQHFAGAVKPPFNIDARAEAGLPYDWYAGLTQI